VWVVGAAGTAMHWDGAKWTATVTPTESALSAVWARSASEAWCVGTEGAALKWDGTTWTKSLTGSNEPLLALSGNAADIWATGAAGVILHH
jgi:photosystem II stability/assembly factor-like uncharacterized protein